MGNMDEWPLFSYLAESLWPGPLTIIVTASDIVPKVVTSGTGFVGIRSPSHPLAISLINASGVPIAAPSANRFGHVSPTTAQHVVDDLGDKGVRVLDGDILNSLVACEHGIESTVIKLDMAVKSILIMRQGAVTQTQFESLLSVNREFCDWSVVPLKRVVHMHKSVDDVSASSVVSASSSPPVVEVGQVAPGQALTHYAPDVPCYTLSSMQITRENDSHTIFKCDALDESTLTAPYSKKQMSISEEQLRRSGVVIDFGQQLLHLSNLVSNYRDLSNDGNSIEAARNLFATLRWSELVPGAGIVLIAPICQRVGESCEDLQMLPGLADRVFRATSGAAVEIQLNSLSDR
jgi:hypothetical protein